MQNDMINRARSLLKSVFGYDRFISLQEEIIEKVLRKNDALVIMPTGGGKSLCYQIPALIFPGVTVVVSPLISLMKDQVDQLTTAGVAAALLNSSLSPEEYHRNVESVQKGQVKLLYLAPETLLKANILRFLSSVKVDCFAIDEAHCISSWGHDFRPEYRQLSDLRNRFPEAVCIALTATATSRVRDDIKTSLGMDTSGEFIASFNRENLYIRVIPKKDPVNQSVEFIKNFPNQSGIIYCFTRRQVDDLYAHLHQLGYSVKPYHAGLTETERHRNQEMFIRDDVQIIVATIAFGMGIDKENIRFILHYDLPQNIESYYQEIGRAGRDGLRSDCLLLFSYGDLQKIKYIINKKDSHEKRVASIHLNALLGFAETDECRRIPLITYFGETYTREHCKMCDNCLAGKKAVQDITVASQKFLSCIKRTGEIFGANHIIDVLRGSKAQKVIKFGHQRLSTYGIGMEYSRRQWVQLSRQFVSKGLLSQDEEFGGLKLTPKAWAVLKGNQTVKGRIEEDTLPLSRPELEELSHDHGLFEVLRKKRKELADAAGVPPYVIFSDKALVQMAAHYPQDQSSFMLVHGVGNVKLEKYGSIFIEVIRCYCRENEIVTLQGEIPDKKVSIPSAQTNQRHIVIGEAYNSGRSVTDIMQAYKIKLDTVLNHLYRYLLEKHSLKPEGLLSLSSLTEDEQKNAFRAFDRLGSEYLGPVFRELNRRVCYDDLKILRLCYLIRMNRNPY